MKRPIKRKKAKVTCEKCHLPGHRASAHKKRKRNPLFSALVANFPAALPL